MPAGVVKWYNDIIGAGIITPDDGSAVITVNAVEVERAGLTTLARGRHVNYKVTGGLPRERSAVDLVPSSARA